MATKTKTKGKKALKVLVIIAAVIAVIAILMTVSGKHKSDPSLVKQYDTQNPYIWLKQIYLPIEAAEVSHPRSH